tara:strand:- start:31192 stop:31314 length:123 start_codon:yes stop_codon:yes gene_type:complete
MYGDTPVRMTAGDDLKYRNGPAGFGVLGMIRALPNQVRLA